MMDYHDGIKKLKVKSGFNCYTNPVLSSKIFSLYKVKPSFLYGNFYINEINKRYRSNVLGKSFVFH